MSQFSSESVQINKTVRIVKVWYKIKAKKEILKSGTNISVFVVFDGREN